MRRWKHDSGTYKYEIGDEVYHLASRWRGKIEDRCWGDQVHGVDGKPLTRHRVKVYRVFCTDYVQRWLSERLLRKLTPLQLLAEQAE